MAQYPSSSMDLLSEVEELSGFVDGKSVGDHLNFLRDDELHFNSDFSSSNSMLFGDYSMLAVDSCSDSNLIEDPVFSMIDQSDMFDLQPAASPDFKLETLIPVSLPADSNTTPIEAPPDHLESETSTLADCSESVFPTKEVLEDKCSSEGHLTDKDIPVIDISKNGLRSDSKGPVRIIVDTRPNVTKKMVAPAIIVKPTLNFVKVPRAEVTTSSLRRLRIQSGRKLGRVDGEEGLPSSSKQVTEVTRPKPNPTPNISQEHLIETPAPSPISERLSSSSSSSEEEVSQETPFWSMRARHNSTSSITSQQSQLSGSKRKAYELEPLGDPRMERCRRNAVNAKKNRELKKVHMAELEERVVNVSRERDQLAGENESLKAAKTRLEQEVNHLRNILKNQSQLSKLIEKLSPSSVAFGDMSSSENEDAIISGGMCLHVDGQEATIEYCSYCAKKAGKKLKL